MIPLLFVFGLNRTVDFVKDWSEDLGPTFSGKDPPNNRRTVEIHQLFLLFEFCSLTFVFEKAEARCNEHVDVPLHVRKKKGPRC